MADRRTPGHPQGHLSTFPYGPERVGTSTPRVLL